MDASLSIYPNDRLRQERIRRNWRQQDVADQLGTTVTSVKRWERGSHQPSLYFREKLCTLFERGAEELGLTDSHSRPVLPPEREAAEEEQTHSFPTPISALWTVPYRRNLYFTGREELLHLLNEHLSGTRSGEGTTISQAALTQPQAIKGLGGIGKTQIAVEYAYRAREQGQYMHTLWINAASREALMTSFTQLADLLPTFAAKNETDQQKLMEAIKHWLEHCQKRWLLIFDNADDLSLVQEYVPNSGNGSILLTTRANAVGSLAVSVEVETLGFIEGTHLLLRRAQREVSASDEEINEAGNIVITLDHFPLALEQAGAYIEETGCSFGDYLQLYQTHRQTLLARRGTQSTNYPDSVATTWSLSFQKIEQSNPAAAELLRLFAFLSPDHIPEELLMDGASHWPPVLQQSVTDPFAFNQTLEVLLSFSLVKRLVEDHLLSIHRLVQIVQLERIGPQEQQQWAERIVRAVNTVFPRDPKEDVASWPQCLRYLEQVQVCATLIQKQRLKLPEAADLLDRSGTYLSDHASYTLAEALYQQAISIREEQLGLHHPDTVSSLKNLGALYYYQGKYAQAEPLYIRALSISEQQLEPYHPYTGKLLNNLGLLYWQQGKYAQAEPLYVRALAIKEHQLGLHHSDLAGTLNNLGMLYQYQGKYEQAEPLYVRALTIKEQQLGAFHPSTAHSLNNLGTLYWEQGKYEQVELFYKRALAIREQQLGLHHPDTANSLNNLAELYQYQGKYEQAELFSKRALAICEQQLGLHHLETVNSLKNLGVLYYYQGKYEQAESLLTRALDIQEQTLVSHHPDLAKTLYGVAHFYEGQGNLQKAAALYQRSLLIREQVYGPHHSKTVETRESFHIVQHNLTLKDEKESL